MTTLPLNKQQRFIIMQVYTVMTVFLMGPLSFYKWKNQKTGHVCFPTGLFKMNRVKKGCQMFCIWSHRGQPEGGRASHMAPPPLLLSYHPLSTALGLPQLHCSWQDTQSQVRSLAAGNRLVMSRSRTKKKKNPPGATPAALFTLPLLTRSSCSSPNDAGHSGRQAGRWRGAAGAGGATVLRFCHLQSII